MRRKSVNFLTIYKIYLRLSLGLILAAQQGYASSVDVTKVNVTKENEPQIEVSVLTTPLKDKVITPTEQHWWSDLFRKKTEIPVQEWLEKVTRGLDLNDRAEIDILTMSNADGSQIVRVPRFMVVRKKVFLKLQNDQHQMRLSLIWKNAESYRKNLNAITKIQLAHHRFVYPDTWQFSRTNPAASRGEKIFVQNCLSCHSVPGAKPLSPQQIPEHISENFDRQHSSVHQLKLDAKEARGLEVYKESFSKEPQK